MRTFLPGLWGGDNNLRFDVAWESRAEVVNPSLYYTSGIACTARPRAQGTRFNRMNGYSRRNAIPIAFLHGWYESVLLGGIRKMHCSTGNE